MATAIRIRVGAAVDRSIGNAFKPIVDAARAARQAIEDEMDRAWAAINGKGAVKGGQGPYRSVVREAEKAANQVVAIETRKQSRIVAEQIRAQRRAEAEQRRATRERERAEFRRGAEKIREWKRAETTERKAGAGRIRAIGGGAVETMGQIGRGALGVAGSIARGAGVQMDLGAYVGQAVELETRATQLAASAYQPGKERRKVQGAGGLIDVARTVGTQAAFDPTKVIEGLQAFVGKTGALDVGEAALPGLAKLARATGTELADMVSAAGDASNALGEVGKGKAFATADEKAKALVATMRTIAGQGKVGAVEISDLAREMAKLGAASMAFGGDKKGNIEFMGALAQMARASGGAAGPAEAATAVQGFVNTLKTPARIKSFMGAGVKKEDIYDEETGALRDPKSIIANALKAAGEDPLAFKKLFANVIGAKTVEPAAVTYREARAKALKGGATEKDAASAGVDAVMQMFNKFGKDAAISAEEESASFKENMETSAAKVQLFNNRLSEIGAKIAEKVLPALNDMAPHVVKAADAFAKMVGFAVENPGTAILAAITASIAKAAIGNAVSGGVSKLIEGAASKMGGLALGTAAITIATATLIAKSLVDEREKGEAGAAEQRTTIAAEATKAETKATTGGLDAEALAALKSQRETVQARIKEGQRFFEEGKMERYGGEGVLDTIAGGARQLYDVATTPTTFEDIGREKSSMQAQPELLALRERLDKLIAATEKNLSKTQKVEVVNMPTPQGPPGPTANTTNTTK